RSSSARLAAAPPEARLALRFAGWLAGGRALLELVEVVAQAIEALLPEAPVALCPVGHGLEGRGFELAGTPLGLPALTDQPGALQHPQVLGDRRSAHAEGRRQLLDRGRPLGEPRQDGAACGI